VFPRVEVRHLHAVIVLAEELNFTRAADRLHITQSGFSKQINEVELRDCSPGDRSTADRDLSPFRSVVEAPDLLRDRSVKAPLS
jgi:Bacterial regulatory helix-turn-helix protein, lysR family